MFKRLCAVVALSTVALPVAAMAAGPLQVESKILVEKRVRAPDGSVSVQLMPARAVTPGDHVVFVLAYRNTGKQPIANLVLDNPVPREIAFRGASAGSPAPEVSIDGKTYAPLASLRLPAAAADVTHVRWRLTAPVPVGAQGQVSFQAVLK